MKLSCVSPAPVMRVLAAVVIGVLAAASASAQVGSGISGVVKDVSGAVLPGVMVEASSPALIEGARSTVTDSSGQYQIIDLRPGDYTVTFSLAGFKTVRREGIRLAVVVHGHGQQRAARSASSRSPSPSPAPRRSSMSAIRSRSRS